MQNYAFIKDGGNLLLNLIILNKTTLKLLSM
ncbi:hypothetical protein EV197_3184 [Aquimarina brevivitae]|uniref:Uncharacterized protein n=1 Tax=Aquimarina brevivitae TaxID=323412 RepID=A0A4Q7NU94_9FLAO|nr:hypothetical protein EV197_3184 [Aquimarina brevivitae]